MAYIQRACNEDYWLGPKANKAGEFVGNKPANDPFKYETVGGDIRYRDDVYIGKPGNWFPADEATMALYSTCEEQTAMGLVGLYLKADTQMTKFDWWREVDTDVLCEEVASGQRPPSRPLQVDVEMR